MAEGTLKVYLRNTQKVGTVLELPSSLPAHLLYREAATSQRLPESSLRLYLNGKEVSNNSDPLLLKDKAIVHLVNLQDIQRSEIQVHVRLLEGKGHPMTVDISTASTIRDFVDHHLSKEYGRNSDKLVLVHLGRQLEPDRTFQQEHIANGSELFCVDVEALKAQRKAQEHGVIYPSSTFPIEDRKEVNATSRMPLIFDSKIHYSSSLSDYSPSQVIPEENSISPPTQPRPLRTTQQTTAKEKCFNPLNTLELARRRRRVRRGKTRRGSSDYHSRYPEAGILSI
jgi:hypothetical protein